MLTGCALAGLPDTHRGPLAAVMGSLHEQAQRLGLALPASTGPLEFHSPAGAVSLAVQGWPDGSDAAASEFLVQAACGVMAVHGRARGGSRALGLDYVSTLTAALTLQGALAAAFGRLRGGRFQQVRMSLGGAALLSVGQYLAGATASEGAETLRPGVTRPEEHPPFISADGVVFELETLAPQPWRALWAGLGIDLAVAGRAWQSFQLRYAKAMAPLPTSLREALAGRSYAEIAARCAQAGVAICPVRSLAERAADVDAQALWRTGPWAFETQPLPARVPPRCDPVLPLSGLTVIESCRRIQGPLAGHLLALLGAQVIRLEPPGGDPLRGMPPMAGGVSARFDALNRLKQVREVDLKTAAGRDQVWALSAGADVFLQNWAPGKAAALGLESEDFARVNPRLVYAQASGWGRDAHLSAHLPALPGTDFMAQAYAGVAHVSGQNGSLFTVLDVLGGAVTAQGVCAALLARELAPERVRVDTSLLGAASLLTARPDQTRSAPSTGLQLVVSTTQGRVALECPDELSQQRLATSLGLRLPLTAEQVQQALACDTVEQALRRLGDAEIAAVQVIEHLADLPHQPRLQAALTGSAAGYVQVASPWSLS